MIRSEEINFLAYECAEVQPKILLVEDNPIIQKINRIFLEWMCFDVDIATTGKEALHYYENDYDLILLDIGLPDISGIEVCRTIRQNEQTQHIPIIALTAYGDFIKEECVNAGVDDFAVKPLLFDELHRLISKVINKVNDFLY